MAVDAWTSNQDAVKYYVPGLSYTPEEKTTRTDLLNPLNTYSKEQYLKFITGERSLDEWDAYVRFKAQ